MNYKFKFELGEYVKDAVTGFEGYVYSRATWRIGANTYGIKSKELTDGKIPMEI